MSNGPEIPVTQLTLDQALRLIDQHREAGQLQAAESLCRDVLRVRPDFPPVLHSLGLIAYQSGKLPVAIDYLRRAVKADGTVALYHCNLGEMHRLAGERDAALAAGRRALALNPNMPAALNNVGIVHYERGEYGEAAAHYRRAIELVPNYVEAYSNLGNALRAQKSFDEALIAYQQARRLRPTFVDAINNMGTALRDMGRGSEAEEAYRQALALSPNAPSVLNNLALSLKDSERFDEAAALLTRSMTLDANDPKTPSYLALIRLEQKRLPEAEAAAARALQLTGDDPEALNAMGVVRYEQYRDEESLALLRRAVARKPDHADAHNNIGNILKEGGQLDAARETYERALAIDPRQAAFYVNLVDAKKFSDSGDPHLAAMEELAQSKELTARDRYRIDFALAKAYDDLGRHDDSFRRLDEANALKRAQIAYDEAGTFALFDRVRAIFDRRLLDAKTGGGFDSALPVFVLGMPRSGTTLVEQILASHPVVHGAGELLDFSRLVDAQPGPGRPFRYPDDAPSLTADALRALGHAYAEDLQRRAPEAIRVTDKMPANFLFIGLIHLALPEAPIIHVMRDPRDTCLSCFSKLFSAEQSFAYELGELGRYYRKYAELMAHWRDVLPPGRMLEVRYEDVVADLEGSAKRIVAHCGLGWDPSCIAFHEAKRPVRTASASQVRRPIYRTSEGRWQAYRDHLGSLLTALGDLTES